MASKLRKDGFKVFPGWRLEITYPGENGTQVRPDLWVLVPLGDGTAMWHAVEVERSATADAAIDRKLAPHRIARDWGGIWPVLVVAGKGTKSERGRRVDLAAAERFAARGSDLPPAGHPLFTGDQGRHDRPRSRWIRNLERVSITHLISTIAKVNRSSTQWAAHGDGRGDLNDDLSDPRLHPGSQ